jgi:hypothetical protein
VLTYAGKKQNSELKISYNPAWQTVELLSATVSNANGKVHAVTPKELNVMDAPWAGGAPRYPASKTLVVTLPGVETGSVISIATRLTQTNACFYSHRHAFGGTDPVADDVYRLTFPRGLTPSVQAFHAEGVAFTAATNETSVVYTWHDAKPPLVRMEEKLPPWHFYQPTLFVSFGDWPSHARRLRHAIRAVSDADEHARQHARQLVKGLRDPRARLLAVRDDVLRTIRIAGPDFLELPLGTLSSPDRTLADQYGHAADRAILLAAMLDAVGFDPEIIFAGSDTSAYPACSQPNIDAPQLDFFENPLVAVSSKGQTYYLNDGDQYDELGTTSADRATALGLDGRIQTLAVPPVFGNASKNAWTIDLDAQGAAHITVSNWFFGTRVGSFRKEYAEMLPEDRRRHHLELVGAVSKSARPASELKTDLSAYPGLRTYSVVADRYAVVDGRTLTLLIPEVSGPVFPVRADTRENPLFLPANEASELTCRIVLPPGYTQIPLLPQARHWALPNGSGRLDYRVDVAVRPDGRREVCITRTIERASAEAAPELYPALLEYNRRFTHPATRTLVAEKENHD